jgi:hypothetical protein
MQTFTITSVLKTIQTSMTVSALKGERNGENMLLAATAKE